MRFPPIIKPILIVFLLISVIFLAASSFWESHNIKTGVVLIANGILFIATVLNLYFQFRNLSNPNPNAIIRGIMAGMFLKLFVLAGAVLIYLIAAGDARNVNAVFVGMGLYIVYTWLEVRISLRLNPRK